MLIERIGEFIRRPESGRFEDLARGAFAFRFEADALFRGLCQRQGVDPDGLTDWHQNPLVPTMAFKSLDLGISPAQATFRSSGTSAADGDATWLHNLPLMRVELIKWRSAIQGKSIRET